MNHSAIVAEMDGIAPSPAKTMDMDSWIEYLQSTLQKWGDCPFFLWAYLEKALCTWQWMWIGPSFGPSLQWRWIASQ